VPDERWHRCWIKSIALLPNVLARNEAADRGYDEAAFVADGGVVTECAGSNLFAVVGGRLVTHPVGPRVLPGITRLVLIDVAARLGIGVDERPLRAAECVAADELFVTSTTRELGWVARWADRRIGDGRCGPLTRRLHESFQHRVAAETRSAPA
jgi:D-alanine transaminase